MNPREELQQLVDRLTEELSRIPDTLQNRLRRSDRTRELARAVALKAKLEHRDRPTRKIRVGRSRPIQDHFNGKLEFPPPIDPDDFLGVEGEDASVLDLLMPVDPDRLEHALSDPFRETDQMTIDELRLVEQRMAGWFTFVPEEGED